jgi:tRNA-Thr(GGU) m(6)t(6)A37 methyltransferase TsaA
VNQQRYELQPVGWVESPLADRAQAPKQGNEGSPDAWLVLDVRFSDAFRDLQAGEEVIVLTWLDRASRDVLIVHPRGDPANPLQGVFSTRSPDRPNPIGLHRVRILAIDGNRIRVGDLEALDRTPIVDVKPVLDGRRER